MPLPKAASLPKLHANKKIIKTGTCKARSKQDRSTGKSKLHANNIAKLGASLAIRVRFPHHIIVYHFSFTKVKVS
jgi:hypothetical protein